MSPLIQLKGIRRDFTSGDETLTVLHGIDLRVSPSRKSALSPYPASATATGHVRPQRASSSIISSASSHFGRCRTVSGMPAFARRARTASASSLLPAQMSSQASGVWKALCGVTIVFGVKRWMVLLASAVQGCAPG